MKDVVIAINLVNYKDCDKRNAQERAMEILLRNATPNVTIHSFNFLGEYPNSRQDKIQVHHNLTRDSKQLIGNSRSLPYVREIFDHAAGIPGDIFGYMNTDILLSREFFSFLDGSYDAYIFSRYEIDTADYFERGGFNILDDKHPGFDAMFFNRTWWLLNNHRFHPNLILGEPAWDDYYNKKIREITKKVFSKRALYHVRHSRTWDIKSAGAKNNICIHYEGR